MFNKIVSIIFSVTMSVTTILGVASAASFTENGITYVDTVSGDTTTRRAEIFNSYSLSTEWGTITGHVGEYHYAEGGLLSGWINLKAFKGARTLQILLPTFTQSGSATFKLQGRIGDSGNGFDIYNYVLTSAGSNVINIVEDVDWFRCGANISAIGTETFSVKLKANSGVPSR